MGLEAHKGGLQRPSWSPAQNLADASTIASHCYLGTLPDPHIFSMILEDKAVTRKHESRIGRSVLICVPALFVRDWLLRR
jgi:hypothetical protein